MKLTFAVVATLGVASLTAGSGVAALASPSQSSATASSPCRVAAYPSPTFVAAHALDAVQFVSATTGWVAGANRVLATTDGGAHWSIQRSAPKADFSEVDAIDAQHAWVVGRHQLLATTDGGATWRELPEPCPVISSVHFISPSNGFAVAGGKLWSTADGGTHWKVLPAPGRVQTVCFTNSHLGWLGAHGQIYRTINRGRVWALVVAGQRPRSKRFPPLADVQCAGPTAGWAELIGPGVGMSQQQHVGYYLNDNGSQPIFAEQSFVGPHPVVKRRSPGAYFAAFSSVDASDAVFIDTCAPCGEGTSPMVIATNDGRTLNRVGRVGHLNMAEGAGFVSTSDGWVVGEKLRFDPKLHATWKIEHTTDGGKRWTTQYVE